MESVVTKQNSETNTMRAHHLLQVDQELEISQSERDLRVIENLAKFAVTDEQKVRTCIESIMLHFTI